ncbi:MAG: hypothetical protein M0Q87_05715 [Ottowia sp.]|nr:hypothetical protein [Ottowia sp.]
MKHPPTAATVRILVFLAIVCAVAFGWETSRNAGLQPVTGTVMGYAYMGYAIRHGAQDGMHHSELRIGLFDRMGPIGRLQAGDEIPLLARPEAPAAVMIDSLAGRHGISLSCFTLLLLFGGVMAWRWHAPLEQRR